MEINNQLISLRNLASMVAQDSLLGINEINPSFSAKKSP
jgi:hypothetical protein